MKIAAFLPRLPWPLDKGDKLRAYHLLKGLSKNHEVLIFALSEEKNNVAGVEELIKFAQTVHIEYLSPTAKAQGLSRALFKGWPLQSGYFYHPKIAGSWKKFIEKNRPDQTFYQLIRSLPYLENIKNIPSVIDYQDAFSVSMQRLADDSPIPVKWIWQRESAKVAEFEKKAFDLTDKQIIISEEDRRHLPIAGPNKVHVISNGIDLERFHAVDRNKDIDIIFAGNMSYRPNIRAAHYLVEKIMPQVWALRPKAKVALVGTHPVRSVRNLAGEQVVVTGFVEDMADWYARSKMLLAPMQSGAGLQNKILEAMAMELPAIVSELAAKGLPDQARKLVLSEQNEKGYADSVITLLNDPGYAAMLGRQGRNYVRSHHNWEHIAEEFEKIFTA